MPRSPPSGSAALRGSSFSTGDSLRIPERLHLIERSRMCHPGQSKGKSQCRQRRLSEVLQAVFHRLSPLFGFSNQGVKNAVSPKHHHTQPEDFPRPRTASSGCFLTSRAIRWKNTPTASTHIPVISKSGKRIFRMTHSLEIRFKVAGDIEELFRQSS